MSQNFSIPVRNRLLASLPRQELEQLQPYLEVVPLNLKQELYPFNEPIKFVYFPLGGVCSLLSLTSEGEPIEVGTVGNEGMIGLPIFLGVQQIPGVAMVQVLGEALRMRAEDLCTQVSPGTALYELLHRYTQTLFNFISQSAVCNQMHLIEQRCCCWLLLTQDRVGLDEFPLTH